MIHDASQPPAPASSAVPVRLAWRCAAVVVLVVAALYGPTLGHGLVYDDHAAVERHPGVQGTAPLTVWTSGFWGPDEQGRVATWRPLVSATFAADVAVSRRLGLTSPAPLMHLHNLAWLAAAGVLVLLWLLELGVGWALATALACLFVVHPGYSEATAFVVGRADVAMVTWGLAFALALRRGRWAWASAALLAALLCKEAAVIWPAAAWLAHVASARQRGGGARAWLPGWLGPVAAVGAVWLAGRWWVLGGLAGAPASVVENPLIGAPVVERVVGAALVWGQAARVLLWPAHLAADHGLAAFPAAAAPSWGALAWSAVALGGVAGVGGALVRSGAFAGRKAGADAPQAALVWCLGLTLGAGLLFGHVLVPLPTVFGERHWVLGGVALVVGVGALGARLGWRGRRTLAALVAGLALLAAARTWVRLPVWASDQTLYEATVRDAPDSVRALVNGASVALERGDVALARRRLLRAAGLHAALPMVHLSLARVEVAAGDAGAADAALARAAEVGGQTDLWWAARCTERQRFAAPAAAVRACAKAVAFRRNRGRRDCRIFYGVALAATGERGQAVAEVRAAMAPGGAPVTGQEARNAGVFFARAGLWAEAARWLGVAHRHAPGDAATERMWRAAQRRVAR